MTSAWSPLGTNGAIQSRFILLFKINGTYLAEFFRKVKAIKFQSFFCKNYLILTLPKCLS